MAKPQFSVSAKKELRAWTRKFIGGYCKRHKDGSERNLWFVNACTGSGKSKLGFESVIQDMLFLEELGKNSINVFVAPTIMLSNQIQRECGEYLAKHYPELLERIEFKIINCQSDDKLNLNQGVWFVKGSKIRHLVLVYCAQSFFGDETRWSIFYNGVTDIVKVNPNWVLGAAVFDEAHNYKKMAEEITGYTAHSEENIVEALSLDARNANLHKVFMDVVCMSGTPAPFQCRMSKNENWENYVVSVNYKMAIDNDWIIRPDVFAIKTSLEDCLEDAVIAVVDRELGLNKSGQDFANDNLHLLVNCRDIQMAYNTAQKIHEYYGDKVDVISLHSEKELADIRRGKNENIFLKSTFNGNELSAQDARAEVEKVDMNPKPTVVFQVAMISEGINVNSFNAVIVTSHSDVKIIQQIGRAVRKFKGKNHTSVYAVIDNEYDLAQIIGQLIDQGLDLESVLSAVKELDAPSTGKKLDEEDDERKYDESQWRKYTATEIKRIEDIIQGCACDAVIEKGIHDNNPALAHLFELVCRFSKFSSSGSKDGSGNSSGTSIIERIPSASTKSDDKDETKKVSSPRQMVHAIMKKIESKIRHRKDWNALYIPNMDKCNVVVDCMLKDLCDDPNCPKTTNEEANFLRNFVRQVSLDLNQNNEEK